MRGFQFLRSGMATGHREMIVRIDIEVGETARYRIMGIESGRVEEVESRSWDVIEFLSQVDKTVRSVTFTHIEDR